jgi:hypothetical protein
MVWIDEVLRSSSKEGLCRVYLKPEAHFFGENGLRQSSAIEWIAQAFGYAWGASDGVHLKTTYLAAFKMFNFVMKRPGKRPLKKPILMSK